MANFYWYGGSGDWSDYENHWSLNSGNTPANPASNAPTSADNVIIDTNSGLEITFQRSISEFTTASTTQQPGFIDAYHDLLAYDTSSTYLMPINTDLAITYMNIFNSRLISLQTDYANRNDDVPRRLTANVENNK